MREYLAGVKQSLPSLLSLIYSAFIVDQLGVLTWNEFYVTRVQELGGGWMYCRCCEEDVISSADWSWIRWMWVNTKELTYTQVKLYYNGLEGKMTAELFVLYSV